MKICVVVINSVWYDPRVRKQIAEYLRLGHEVRVVGHRCNRYEQDKVAMIPAPTKIVHVDRYQGKQRSPFKKLHREHLRKVAVTEAIIETGADVIHANDYDALVPAYAAAKKMGCVLIYDSHEVYVENDFVKRLPTIFIRYMKMNERRICRRLDQMVCVSHAAAEYFANIYGIPRPMVVTNCALEREAVSGMEKHPQFEILNHGQFYEGRGYDLMIEAAPLLRDLPELRLALRGFGRMEEQLRKRTEELKAENVIFYPKVLVQELIPEASKSHVGVAITEPICLNFKLSVSNKLFEYAAAGLPVIMSDIPEHRYLNEKYGFGIIIPDNSPKAFAEAAIRLYTDKEFYAKCVEGAKRMTEEVNWENEFAGLVKFEESCVIHHALEGT
ncbi:MAG: glycosyltransferase family 4 protein [Oscillospiraceae bacterium]|nr:glycosyltransferase family 4 protein [Oscillospiraceae bacterium]